MSRRTAFFVEPSVAEEAPGVLIRRTVGGDRLIMLDPLFLFDHATVNRPEGGEPVGFARHPHRGIETLSFVFEGTVGHRDSIGNEGQVGAWGAQWMRAGNGIFHEEMLIPGPNGAEFLQLWFNLPVAHKRDKPAYMGVSADSIPQVTGDGWRVAVAAGEFGGAVGPLKEIIVKPSVFGVTLQAGASLELPSRRGDTAALYPVRGSVQVSGDENWIDRPGLCVLTDGDEVTLTAGPEGAVLLFVSARPLNEPVMQFRSFVMNTSDDIEETLRMIAEDHFGKGE